MKALYRFFYYVSILLTGILAISTLAGIFVGNASPNSNKLLPFIGLILPVLLLMNLGAVIYWIIRWRCWLFIPLSAIIGNWAYISNILQFPVFDSAAAPRTSIVTDLETQTGNDSFLTVATYNVDSFNQEHTGFLCKEIAEYMKNLGVDIFCFQEFGINKRFGVDSLYTALSEWAYHYIPSSPEGEHLLQLAVFSRYPIKDQQLITYPETANNSFWCDIDINGRTVRLFNNHLQTTDVSRNKRQLEKELKADDSERIEYAAITLVNGLHNNFKKRAAQAEKINQLIATSPYPTLVCGDFNSLPSSYTYHTIKGKLNDGFQTCGHGYMYTFRSFKHLLRIDYIFHSQEFEGVDYFSPNLNYSDHNPVVMRMKWQN